ncbi:hypothetical protein ACIO87_34485 [Streptomyces sp. NPDC087218]|uniref:hypothetical protein n=1 Tax=Streptomyces sp. NPDC087218 TaxID=3365769 RepID=UPI0037FDF427
MFAFFVGVSVLVFGVCLSGNFWNLADRIFDYYSSRIVMGASTVGTFRLMGGGAVLIGLFWIATALSEIL